MVCVLNDAQQKAFLKKVAKDLYSMTKAGKSFNLKDYITSIYNRVKEKTGDEAKAQTYAALVPTKIGLARQFNKDIRKLVSNIQQLEETQDLLENIDNVPEYLGVVKQEPLAPKEDPVAKAQNAFDLANPVQPTVSTFSARPNSLFTTTGNEQDQDLIFSYAFLRNFILNNENSITSESNGYYLTMAAPERVLGEQDVTDKRNLYGYITYVSDNEGNAIYFDENFERTTKEKGKLVFFNVRETEGSLQTVSERMKTLGMTEEQVKQTFEFQKKLLRAKENYLLENKESNFVVHEITFIGKGFIEENSKNQNSLKDHATFFENATISVEPGKEGKKENRFFERPGKARVSFKANPVEKMDPDFIEKALDILMGADTVEDIAGNKGESLTKTRQKFKDVYFGNNTRIKITNEGQLLVEGAPVTSREQLKNTLFTYLNAKGIQARNSLNVYQNYAAGVPFYTVKGDKIVLDAKGKSKADYINFILQNSFTEMTPEASGDFVNRHPYFGFKILDSEQEKVSKKKTKRDKAPVAEETTETKAEEKVEEKKGFQPLVLKAPKTKSNDQLKLDKLVNQKEVSETITPEQLAKAEEWYNTTPGLESMRKHVPFKKMFEIINTANPKSVATFTEAGITLFKGSDSTDLYHEAFHAFTQLFLSSEQRQKLYDETRKLTGSFTDFEGNKVSFANANDLQVEEYLAEKFRKYMLADGKMDMPASPAAKSFFQKLLDILKALFNVDADQAINNYEASNYLGRTFYNLRVGNINKVPFGYENRKFDKLDKITAINPDLQDTLDELPYSMQIALVDSIDALFSQIVDELNAEEAQASGKKYTTVLINDINKRVDLYNRVLETLVKKYNQYGQQISSFSEDSEQYAELYAKIKTLGAGIMNFSHNSAGDPEKGVVIDDILLAESQNSGLIAYHMQKSKYMSFEDKFNIVNDPEDKSLNDRDGYSHLGGNELSAKDLAANDVLYTIRGIFEYDAKGKPVMNELGFPKLQDFDVSWNRISKLLEGSKKADQMFDLLSASKSPDLKQFLTKIGNPEVVEGQALNLSQHNLWTHIVQAFSLKRIPLIQVSVHVNGNNNDLSGITVGNAIAETDSIKRAWDNNFMSPKNNSAYVINKNNEARFLNVRKVLNDFATSYNTDPIRFLNAIGMQVTDNVNIKNLLASKKSRVSTFTEIIWGELKRAAAENKFINKPSELIGDEQTGIYDDLLRLELKYSDKYGTALVSNAKGDPQFELSLRSTASEMIDYLNDAKSYAELIAIPEMSHLDVSRNPQIKGLRMMVELFGEDFWKPGKGLKQSTEKLTRRIQNKITLLNSSGVQVIKDDDFRLLGASSNESDSASYYMQNFYMMLKYGVAEGTRHSDKSTTYLYRMQFGGKNLYIPFDEFEGDGVTAKRSFQKAIMGYLAGEVEKIYKLQNGDSSGTALVGDKTYKEVASKIIGLEDIFGPSLNARIEKNISDNFMETLNLPKNTKLRQDIETAITNYIERRAQTFKDTLIKAGVFDNEKLMNEVTKYAPVTDATKAKDVAVMAFVMNDFMHKFETTTLLYGDVALYNHLKEEFHKRNAGVGATGTIPRTDNPMIQLLNDHFVGKYSQSASFKASGFELKNPSRTWGRTMRSAVLEDTKLDSTYINEYIELAKKSEARRLGRELTAEELKQVETSYKDYKEMKAGDGQGWISFDAYRALLVSLGKWSQYQEDMYNAIIRGEDISVKDVTQFFPIKKMQYWGPLKTDGLNVIGFHKFSLMPLIPTVVKNSNLEILHNKMTAEGIDYALFQSGSKINTITKDGKVDKFYVDPTLKEGRVVSFADPDYEFAVNEIYLNYFKDQLEIADTYKNKVIFSTQLRKLVEEGLMQEGKPVDYSGTKEQWDALPESEKLKNKFYAKIINYEKLVRQLTEFKTDELIKEADITFENGQFKVTDKLINFLKKELTRQDLADHEIDFLKYESSGKMVYDLSIHPSAGQLEKLVSALVYKRIVRQKVSGEALIQVSGVGFEPSSLRAPTEEESRRFGAFGLPFYKYDENGTRAMKVKIALQGDFKKLLKHPDVIAESKALGINALDALNNILKDEERLNKTDLRQMITITGVRIPVQGLNSMEFMEVFEFLPENSGNMIILPAEMVAKSGSDFDIDKLSLMFPSILKTSKGVSIVKHDKSLANKLDKDVVKQQIKQLYMELDKANEQFLQFAKDYLAETPEELKFDFYDSVRFYRQEIKKVQNNIWNEYEMGEIYPEELYEQLYDLNEELNDLFAEASRPLKEKRAELLGDTLDRIDALKTDLAKSSSKGIENELLASITDILSTPELFTDLTTPNGTFLVKPLAEDLAKDVRDYDSYDTYANEGKSYTYKNKKNEDVNRISATRIFETEYNEFKQGSNNIGKKTLGLGAVDNTYNTIFNRIGAYMSREASLGSGKNKYTVEQVIRGMEHNTMTINGEKVISLSQLYDANKKNRISTVISQMMNGWVDVAKDSWIFDVQGNSEISPVLLFMIQAGIPLDQAVYFVSQPIIRDYVKIQRKVRSTFAIPMQIPSSGTNLYRIEARKQLLSALFPGAERIGVKANGKTYDKLDVYNQKKTIYEELVPEYLENMPIDFSVETLKKSVKDTGTYDTSAYQLFVHFIELEEMAKATTAVKLGMNFDTSKLTSIYEIREKLGNIGEILKERRMPFEVIEKIEDQSPIGGFKTNHKLLDMISNLFPTRDNEYLEKAIKAFTANMTNDDISARFGAYFNTKADLVNGIKNDFINFVFQQYLLNINKGFDPKAAYKGLEIESAKKLGFGAIAKQEETFTVGTQVVGRKGKMVVDFAKLNDDYKTKAFSKPSYLKTRKLAIVPESYFSEGVLGKNEFMRFVYERENLRSIIPFDVYSTSDDYKYRVEKLTVQSDSLPENVELGRIAYEEFLRDNALLNTKNIPFMFKDNNGFAKQISEVLAKHPELAKKYPVLDSFYTNKRQGVTNLKLSELIMDSDTANEYHENISDLADTSIQKVDNQLDNAYISKLFSILPVFAFIQSGQGAKGQLNLGKVMPSTNLSNTLSAAIKYALETSLSNEESAADYLEFYFQKFNAMYSKPMEDELGLPEEINTVKPIMKNYYGEQESEKEKTKFFQKAQYDPSVLMFNSEVDLDTFKSKIKQLSLQTVDKPSVSKKIQEEGEPEPVTQISRSTKKEEFSSTTLTGNTYTKTGYKIIIPQYPNSKLYITKDIITDEGIITGTDWHVEEVTTSRLFPIEFARTLPDILEEVKETINKQLKSPKGREVLKSVGFEQTSQAIGEKETVIPGVEITRNAITKEEQLELFNILKPYIEQQGAKTNKAASANVMIGLGLRWDYKSNNPNYKAIEIKDIITPGSSAKYGYYEVSINGQPLGPISPRIKELMTKATGVDATNYDGAIINLYKEDTFISAHNDVDEAADAIGYPVLVLNIGGSGNFSVEQSGKYEATPLNAGDAYVFGINGQNRKVMHRTFPSKQNGFLPKITTALDGKTYKEGEYRISITLRRVKNLEPGMSKVPVMIGTQSATQTESVGPVVVTDNSSEKYSDFNVSRSGEAYNSTILRDMAKEKEIPADMVRAIVTKNKSFTNKNVPGDFLTDDTYESNVDSINKFINKLIEDRDVYKRKIYFDTKGIGNALLGYAGDESLTEKNKMAGKAPAPKTFVYLSKRLYEEFGYINPGLYKMDATIQEGIQTRAQIVKKQTVTDDMVREKFRECFKSLLGS